VQQRVDAADQKIAVAIAKLAEVSGVDRAAQLLDQPLGVVKRAVNSSSRNRTRDALSISRPPNHGHRLCARPSAYGQMTSHVADR